MERRIWILAFKDGAGEEIEKALSILARNTLQLKLDILYYMVEIRKEQLKMAKDRFVETYSQGVTNVRKIIVDTETGVNYVLMSSGKTSGCGMTVLVDKDGKPIITPINPEK